MMKNLSKVEDKESHLTVALFAFLSRWDIWEGVYIGIPATGTTDWLVKNPNLPDKWSPLPLHCQVPRRSPVTTESGAWTPPRSVLTQVRNFCFIALQKFCKLFCRQGGLRCQGSAWRRWKSGAWDCDYGGEIQRRILQVEIYDNTILQLSL